MDVTMIKTILLTVSVTLAVVGFVASMFLNTILGAFSLTATSIAAMNSLQVSQGIVQKMKDRNKDKKLDLAKQFVKRSSKRVGATASAAATTIPGVAVVAVAIVSTGLEVSHYCDQQRELQSDSNILDGTNIDFDTKQCLEAAKEDAKAIWEEVKKLSTDGLTSAVKEPSKFSEEIMDRVRKALESAGGTASEVWDEIHVWLTK
jgi:hypothetical protein